MRILFLIFVTFLLNSIPTHLQNTTPAHTPELLPITSENASRAEQLNILGYGLISAVAWSPDGKTVAAATTTGVIIYDANLFDRGSYYRINLPEPDPVSIVFSPDGRFLGIVSQPKADSWDEFKSQPKTVDIWDFKSQFIVAEWKSHIDYPAIDFSPNGDQVVLHEKHIAQVWNIHNIAKIQMEGEVSWKRLQQQWYIPSNVQLDEINLKKIIAFVPNGQYVAKISENHTTQIWDVNSKSIINTIPYESDDLMFSSNGGMIALVVPMEGYSELTIWDVDHNTELYHSNEALTGIAFNPTKPQLLIANAISNLKLWDKTSDTIQIVLGYSEQWWHNDVYSTAFNPQGNKLAVARMYQIEVWDSTTGLKLRVRDANEDGKYLNRIIYSPDGKLLASAGQDGYVRLWDANTLEPRGAIQHSGNAYDVAFSPDGKLLATYSNTDKSDEDIDPTAVYLWRVSDLLNKDMIFQSKQALARIYHINLHNDIYNVRFSPDGKTIAITGVGIDLWDVGTVLNHNQYAHKDGVDVGLTNNIAVGAGPIAWGPDGKRIAVGQGNDLDCSFAIINIIDDRVLTCMKGHTGKVTSLAFNPSGDLIASASSSLTSNIEADSDNTVRLWDTVTGKQLSLLNKHYEDVWTVMFNSSGTLIASGSGGCYHCQGEGNSIDGTVRLWGVPKS